MLKSILYFFTDPYKKYNYQYKKQGIVFSDLKKSGFYLQISGKNKKIIISLLTINRKDVLPILFEYKVKELDFLKIVKKTFLINNNPSYTFAYEIFKDHYPVCN